MVMTTGTSNGPDRGAWYCAFEVETAIDEVAYHLTKELAAIDRFENVTDYAELYADFIGPFHDHSFTRDGGTAARREDRPGWHVL